jgi:hypothetical protein
MFRRHSSQLVFQSPKTLSRECRESFVVGDDTLCLKTGMDSSGARGVFKMWCQNVTTGMRHITSLLVGALVIRKPDMRGGSYTEDLDR